MEGIRSHSAAAAFLAEALGGGVFGLVDVGCAGGIDGGWRVFGHRLRALAFDASVPEIDRLRAEQSSPNIEYLARLVGPPAGHALDHELPHFNWWRRNPWDALAIGRHEKLRAGKAVRVEDACAQRWAWPAPDPLRALPSQLPVIPADPSRIVAVAGNRGSAPSRAPSDRHGALMAENRWRETETAIDAVHLPDILLDRGMTDVDFIKIDVDGPDYAILTSLDEVLDAGPVLALGLEVNFFGNDAPHHHSFHNTDRYMRSKGFDLFGLTVRTYASAALPQRHVLRTPGAAIGGRPIQGDALYARDSAWKGDGERAAGLSEDKLLKLAAIFALCALPDQAAEVLIRHRHALAHRLDLTAALNLLVEEAWPGLGLSHAELIARFDSGHAMFEGDAG